MKQQKKTKTKGYTILNYNSIKFLNQCFFMTLRLMQKCRFLSILECHPPFQSFHSSLASRLVFLFVFLFPLSVPHNKDSQKIILTFQSTFAASVFVRLFCSLQIVACPLAQGNGIYSKTFRENIDVLHILNLEVQKREIRMGLTSFFNWLFSFSSFRDCGKEIRNMRLYKSGYNLKTRYFNFVIGIKYVFPYKSGFFNKQDNKVTAGTQEAE